MNACFRLSVSAALAAASLACSSTANESHETSDAGSSADRACPEPRLIDDYCASGALGCADNVSTAPACVDGRFVCEAGVPWSSCGPCRGQTPDCCVGSYRVGYAFCDEDAGWTCDETYDAGALAVCL